MSRSSLQSLASEAGLEPIWRDVNGVVHTVSDESLLAVLKALDLHVQTEGQVEDARLMLESEQRNSLPKLITADQGHPTEFQALAGSYRITLESGTVMEGDGADGAFLPPIDEPGYHHVEFDGQSVVLAVAPRRSFTMQDVAPGQKLWGLAVQLYGLRRAGDGGVGDFAALAEFAQAAARHGADCVAISPVHAQFSGDVTRFGPYAPSSRAALNVNHIAEPSEFFTESQLVDWPKAAAAKLQALRNAFKHFDDFDALDRFRATAGIGLERHAAFEAIHTKLNFAGDWRRWPEPFQDPQSVEVVSFLAANAEEVAFHTYLQYRAERDFAAAQAAARHAGMRIGLIADLAVGTDPGGSQSWSRQGEILRGLEIGAPPDAINREGQSWGITAFSPRGLRNSGFLGFIEMVRHALRHAGGVRIDHVMGLARLWVIPHGFSSAGGAYLRLPAQDLIRLVTLESHRHKALILGEDLGTLPEGFQPQLESAGIAGLRVLWFEKSGDRFNSPLTWSGSAVAMTTTHDLPTVAGWWQGQDIAWRERLGMAGDDVTIRTGERAALWAAFRAAGVTSDDMPTAEDGAAAANAACAFLGKTASSLALLPIEDALALPEQPNLPGTTDEHPNWRRRLPGSAADLLDRPDVATRLSALNTARQA